MSALTTSRLPALGTLLKFGAALAVLAGAGASFVYEKIRDASDRAH